VYDNIRKFVKYAMSGNIGEVFVMIIGVLFGMPLPLLPLQILWVNLVTDGLPGLALAAEPSENGTMQRRPLPPEEPIFNRRMLSDLIWIGVLICIASLGTGFLVSDPVARTDHWRTIVFTVLTLTQMANVFACRSERPILNSGRIFTNGWLWAAVASTFLLQLAVIWWPPMQAIFHTASLTPVDFAWCLLASLLVLGLIESFKLRHPLDGATE
jgi:Ca2+-transporting ATPase